MKSPKKSFTDYLKFAKYIAGVGVLLIAIHLWGQWNSDVVSQKTFYSDEDNWKAAFEVGQVKLEKAKYMIAPEITWHKPGFRQGIGIKDLKVEVEVQSPQIPDWKGKGHEFWHIPLDVGKAGEYVFNVNVTTPDQMLGGDMVIKKVPFDYRPFLPLSTLFFLAGIIASVIGTRMGKRDLD